MAALDISTEALVVLAGVALAYFGSMNLLVPMLLAIPPRFRNVPDGPDQHVRPSTLISAAMGAAALVIGVALLSLVFTGGTWIENLAAGAQGLGGLLLWVVGMVGLLALASIAGKTFHLDFSSRYWVFGIAVLSTALEAYLIDRYVTQHDPVVLVSALIVGILTLLRWALAFYELRRPSGL